ncbi:T9SS type B sorting domain-containing protein, partial [Flavobacterium sp.]|uniref:T9SS type B sorting domain-containing protein n=1 Tax=Flavobacterium sp. TaxID=239 RepID=UPI00286B4DB1
GGCSNVTATRTVTVTAAPVVGTLSGNQSICVGLTSVFSSTAVGGTWSSSDVTVATINSAAGLVTGVAAGTATMTYTVLGTGGCANVTATRIVTVTAAPIAGTLSGNQIICQGSSTVFTSTSPNGNWSSSAISIATVNASTGIIYGIAAGTATITYTVLGTGGCANVTATRTVTVKPTPQIIATNPITICSGDSPNINLVADFPGTTFTWAATQNNATGAFNGSGNFINPILTSTAINGGTVIYTVIPTLNNCVGNPAYIIVNVKPKPVPELNDGVVCIDIATGITSQTYTFTTNLNNTNFTFQWYLNNILITGANANTYEANQEGIYSVIATNTQTGCISEEVFGTVTASIYTTTYSVSVSEAFSDNSYIIIHTPSGSGPFQYQLDSGPLQDSNIFYNMINGLHKITVTDEAGCTHLEGEVLILGYPKFFTPNGDTYNDTWNILGLKDLPNSGIYIFDRYGKFIKQISPLGKGWDGTYNGHELPSTDYWFTVDYVDPNSFKNSTFKSHFSLKR